MENAEYKASLIRRLPPMGIGFLLVAMYWGGALAIGAALWSSGTIQDSSEFLEAFAHYQWTFVVIILAAWAYWLYCVYAIHKVLADVPGWRHPTTPARAVGLHFIPLYNLYWFVKWPSQVADFVNWGTRRNTMSRWLPGSLIVVGIAFRFVEAGLGTGLVFGVGAYLIRNIKRALLTPPPFSQNIPPAAAYGESGDQKGIR